MPTGMSRVSTVRAYLFGSILACCYGCSSDPSAPLERGPLGDRLPIAERLELEGLGAPVNAVRDVHGRTHIYAESFRDALLAEGYLVARDRTVQLDLFRRFGAGSIAEALSEADASLVETDIAARQVGLARVAREQWQQLDDQELRAGIEAYASGVTQLFREIRSGQRALPKGVVFWEPALFEDWTPVDSLVLGRLQTMLLSYDDTADLDTAELLADFQTTFAASSADPLMAARAGIERDYIRFAPPDPATTIDGFGAIGATSAKLAATDPASKSNIAATSAGARPVARPKGIDPSFSKALRATRVYRRALSRLRAVFAPEGDFGSNNWAVGPMRSQTGRAMLASDPHLALSSPSVFWPVSLHVGRDPDIPTDSEHHVGGIAFPGIPGIILGHNRHVAWGGTVTGYDVTDVWRETLTSDGGSVIHNGQPVPLETVDEVIELQDGSSVTYQVKIVPHHGPIVPDIVGGQVVDPDPATGAFSVAWTGHEPTREVVAVFGLLTATNVDEARAALVDFGTGGQNWMLADDKGDIAWSSHQRVPIRPAAALSWDPATYQGLLPCLTLPGDGSTDWSGYWADDSVPWTKNPAAGYLATANQDSVGGTLDNDPSNDPHPDGHSGYLGCFFDHGFREGRVQARIEGQGGALSLDDMQSIQADVRSPLGSRLVPSLLLAIDSAQAEAMTTGTHPDLTTLVASAEYQSAPMLAVETVLAAWRDESDYVAHSGVSADDSVALPLDAADPRSREARASQATLLFNAWLVHFARRVLGDELAQIGRTNGGDDVRAILHLVLSDPATLATYDSVSGDSVVFDDLTTPALESRQERMIRALLDALALLTQQAGAMDDWRWGRHHTVRFSPDVPLWGALAIPPLVSSTFPDGFPRPGDLHVVDASNYGLRLQDDGTIKFAYGSGPTQRFVIELDPDGLEVRNALPGGAVWDVASSHFADQAEAWRRNQTFEVPFVVADVVANAETCTLAVPKPQ